MRRALWFLNAFLTVSLGVLCTAGGLYVLDVPIPLPRRAAEFALSKIGIVDAACDAVYLSPRGRIVLDGVRARFKATPRDFLAAKRAELDISPRALLGGELAVRGIGISRAKIRSPFSENAESIDLTSLSAGLHGGVWDVRNLSAKIAGISVFASGFADAKNSPYALFENSKLYDAAMRLASASAKDGKAKTPLDKKPPVILGEILDACAKAKKYADLFDSPTVCATFLLSGGATEIRVSLNSKGVEYITDFGTLRARDIRAEAGLAGDKITLSARIENAILPENTAAKSIDAFGEISADGGKFALKNPEISATDVSAYGAKAEFVSAKNRTLTPDNWQTGWRATVACGNGMLYANTVESGANGILFELGGTLDPSAVFNNPNFADIQEFRQFAFPAPINIFGSGFFDAKKGRISASAHFWANGFAAMNIPVENAYGDIRFDSESGVFEAFNTRINCAEGWSLYGGFEQNLKTYDYFIRLNGSLRPMAIAHFMEDWWTNIMKAFEFEKAYPKADFYVEGRWGNPDFIWCFGSVLGANAFYEGRKFDDFSLTVWVNPRRISLLDISIRAGSRTAFGWLEWAYGNDGLTSYLKQRIELKSTLSPDELIALGGDDAREVLDIVHFKNPPEIEFSALMFNPRTDPEKPDIFNLTASSQGITEVEGVEMENASFRASSNKILTQITDAEFGFCSGRANGFLTLEKTPDKKILFDAFVNASKMNQAEFGKFLACLGKSGRALEDAKNRLEGNSFIKDGTNGTVGASAHLTGDVDRIEFASGNGFALLENADLMKLHLLGLVSRALDTLHLPLGTFALTKASSPFELGNGTVRFGDIRMSGPVMKVAGNAAYDYLKDNLDSTITLSPLGSVNAPIISTVSNIIAPITGIFEAHLSGSIENPNVGINVRPLNIVKQNANFKGDASAPRETPPQPLHDTDLSKTGQTTHYPEESGTPPEKP